MRCVLMRGYAVSDGSAVPITSSLLDGPATAPPASEPEDVVKGLETGFSGAGICLASALSFLDRSMYFWVWID